jgi:hypothetical protein
LSFVIISQGTFQIPKREDTILFLSGILTIQTSDETLLTKLTGGWYPIEYDNGIK